MSHVYSKLTSLNGVLLARAYEEILTGASGNAYVGLGRSSDWDDVDPPLFSETIENYNDVFRNVIAFKRINSADVNLVVPDIAWATDTVYDQFNSDEEMYSHEDAILATGRIDYVSGNVITGNNDSTLFLNDLSVGDIIEIGGELTAADLKVRREVISITNNYHAIINTSMSSAYSNSSFYRVDSVYPRYAKEFYARNASDEVFICIYNNGNTASNLAPTSANTTPGTNIVNYSDYDGYLWEYLYTIPAGLSEKFAYADRDGINWIPVITDVDANDLAVDGSIDHIRILDGGTLYNSNTPSTSVDIITVGGDGASATYTAVVESSAAISDKTTIAGLYRANSGGGYTYATVTASGGDGGASFKPLISPVDGFAYDPAKDLGAKFLGISTEFSGTVSGTIPEETALGGVQFRQVSIVNNIKYANNAFVDVSSVAMTSNLEVAYSGSASIGDVVYKTVTGNPAATVVGFNNPYILLNNITETLEEGDSFTLAGSSGTVVSIVSQSGIKRSGDVVYVENIDAVTRAIGQVEVIKLVLKF